MRFLHRRRSCVVIAAAVISAALCQTNWHCSQAEGAEGLTRFFRKQKKVVDKSRKVAKESGPLDYPMIGDNTGIDGLRAVKVEGIGLVVGLSGTGSDPPPNGYRDQILQIMQKKDIHKPKGILASEDTAVVLLRAFIPPGARKGDQIDVEVWIPPGDGATSLKGGRLLHAELFTATVVKGRRLQGDSLLEAEGPVLVTPDPTNPEHTAALQKGKILGQGTVTIDRDFRVILARDVRSGHLTKALAHRINRRFPIRDGSRIPVANAKDEQMIELKLIRQYRFDIERYLQVVRRIPRSVSPTFLKQKLEYLSDELLSPIDTIEAGLRMEAIGPDAVTALKRGLNSRLQVVRFSAAQSLAYLGDPSGADELSRLAEESIEYRAYALSALVALDHPTSRIALSRLLHAKSAETRYGAFRALWALDENDRLIHGENLNNQFHLHVVESNEDPMIHLSRNFRREIVLFNNDQKLHPPLLLRAGNVIINAAEENERAQLASITPSPDGPVRRSAQSDFRVASVIRAAVSLGATYPEVMDLIQQAYQNGNIETRLEMNALPRAMPLEALEGLAYEEANAGRDQSEIEDGQPKATRFAIPSLFAESDQQAPPMTEERDIDMDEEFVKPSPRKRSFLDIFRRNAQ